MMRIRRVAAVVALTAAGLVAAASSASAHAILLATAPADGSVLRTSPSQVSLRFDEAVGRSAYLTVTGPNGRVDAGAATVDGAVVSVKLHPVTAHGRYTVAFRVVSDDGHPVEGTFRYQLARPAAAATPASSASSGASASTPPSAAAAPSPGPPQAAIARIGTDTAGQGGGTHWFAAFAGIAVVLAGAGALVWERLNRGSRRSGEPPT